jgi:hypothetical protein
LSGDEKPSPKRTVVGDDPIDSFEADWFGFEKPAVELANMLYKVSETSGVCCGIIGSWGSGKTSFMKLMDEYARKNSDWKNVHTVWFTAWDPGGIEDLGNALLLQFFRRVVGDNEEMADALKKLEEAVGVRVSLRERTRRVLEKVVPYLPMEAKAVAGATGVLIEELESSVKVRDCFDELMRWLEKEKRKVFLFVDDLDRATGRQILDILSELRLYINRRRIIAVLGYSEDYVLKALGGELPKEIEPKEYLEKIITVKRSVPTPTPKDLENYAKNMMKHLLPKMDEGRAFGLGIIAAGLSLNNNPRKLKRLILTFSQLVSPIENYEKLDLSDLLSSLLTTAAFDMGFLVDEKVTQAIEDGGATDRIRAALQEFANKNPNKRKEVEVWLQNIPPVLEAGTVSRLRLAGILPSEVEEEPEVLEREKKFNWRRSFLPILESSVEIGFTLTSEVAEFPIEITIPQHTRVESFKGGLWIYPGLEEFCKLGHFLSWNEYDMLVFLTSKAPKAFSLDYYVNGLINCCPCFVVDRGFLFLAYR